MKQVTLASKQKLLLFIRFPYPSPTTTLLLRGDVGPHDLNLTMVRGCFSGYDRNRVVYVLHHMMTVAGGRSGMSVFRVCGRSASLLLYSMR